MKFIVHDAAFAKETAVVAWLRLKHEGAKSKAVVEFSGPRGRYGGTVEVSVEDLLAIADKLRAIQAEESPA